jgi:hypothetical protein
MPYKLIAQVPVVEWGDLDGDISKQNDLQNKLSEMASNSHTHPEYALKKDIEIELEKISEHAEEINNPHQTTKYQVGLGDVSNDAQLKRRGGDFLEFEETTELYLSDYLIVESKIGRYEKRKVKLETLKRFILS